MIISSTTLGSSALPETEFVDADSQDVMNAALIEVVLLFRFGKNRQKFYINFYGTSVLARCTSKSTKFRL